MPRGFVQTLYFDNFAIAMSQILVIGSSNYDMFCYVNKFPNPGETIFGSSFIKGFGGKGANQSVCASILGANVNFVGCLGNDSFGTDMLENFKSHGVDTANVIISSKPTGVALITVNAKTGENNVIVVPGANLEMSSAHVDEMKDIFKKSSILSCQNEINLATTLQSLKLAKQVNKDIITIFNPSPFQGLSKECFQDIDICIVNEHELKNCIDLCLCKSSGDIKTDSEQILDQFHLSVLVVTLGKDGAFIMTNKKKPSFVGSIPDGKKVNLVHVRKELIKDTTGAGDCFTAAFCVGLLKKISLLDACRRACEIASESIKFEGCQASYTNLKY